MAAPQNFRTAFNGFNREDVVHYLEYLNTKHNNQINQLTAENESLRQQLSSMPEREDQQLLITSLEEKCEDLTRLLEQAQARCDELERAAAQKASAEVPAEVPEKAPVPVPAPEPVLSPSAMDELETYRRAERTEREARERAELVYFQANSVLTEAAAKVDGITCDITEMADKVMNDLTQLQVAVSSSKQALQDASSIMNAIRPNK